MNYLTTEQQQANYSEKKLPELYTRYNEMEARHQKEKEELDAKIKRHESIVKNWENS